MNGSSLSPATVDLLPERQGTCIFTRASLHDQPMRASSTKALKSLPEPASGRSLLGQTSTPKRRLTIATADSGTSDDRSRRELRTQPHSPPHLPSCIEEVSRPEALPSGRQVSPPSWPVPSLPEGQTSLAIRATLDPPASLAATGPKGRPGPEPSLVQKMMME